MQLMKYPSTSEFKPIARLRDFCPNFRYVWFSSIVKQLHICSFVMSRHDWYSKFKHKFTNLKQVLSSHFKL